MKNFSIRSLVSRMHFGISYDPVRDWLLLLTAAGVALAAIIAWNIWSFSVLIQGGSVGAPAQEQGQALNTTTLNAIHAVFASRAAEETKYQDGTYSFGDPSQ